MMATRDTVSLPELIRCLQGLRTQMLELEEAGQAALADVRDEFRPSVRNLIHYLALRRQDLRRLQDQLARVGLSSLGRSESHVLSNIDAVLRALRALANEAPLENPGAVPLTLPEGDALLERNTDRLLGPKPAQRGAHIMVTMPSEAAEDYALVHELVKHGMDCMRINCAHDGPAQWERMIAHLHRAARDLGQPCKVEMDLGGPKLRTGPLETGPQVLKYRPRRDIYGQVLAPARIWLTSQHEASAPLSRADACVPVDPDWLKKLRCGDRVVFRDARNARRVWRVSDVTRAGAWAEADRTGYLVPDLELIHRPADKKKSEHSCRVGALPAREIRLTLQVGDTIVLTREPIPGRGATSDAAGQLLTPAHIGCTLPEVFDDVQAGEHIWFDDGKIGGIIRSVSHAELHIQITQAQPCGSRLRGDKGINLPDTALKLPALTAKDLEDLPFVVKHADIVGYSFVRTASDVAELVARLSALGGDHLGVLLKIETRRAFEQLPSLLLAAMRARSAGVMIARGDLAIECGYVRLAEIQEEILWIAEAGHVPVVWATQVLESLAKEGEPSRAEISDAASAQRAECVMLNKGPHITRAVQTLDDILQRMQAHQTKKRSMLRPLKLALGFPFVS